jgi:signal transduction histidine kinase
LRTPLTSLRLQAEVLGDEDERRAMLGQMDRLEHAMNQVIELARSRATEGPGECDIDAVVARRGAFWSVLAEEQGRALSLRLGAGAGSVPLGEDDVAAAVDTLIGNVFSHTHPGVDFDVATGRGGDDVVWLEVADRGTGFGDTSSLARGVSGAGSTGLGLDIVRKTVQSVSGRVEMSNRPGGGAVVRVFFG